MAEVMVSKAEVKVKLKLWAVEKLKNQSRKSMHARGQKFGVKTRPQIFLAQNSIFLNGSTTFRFLRNPRKSSSTAFQFLISSTAFRFQTPNFPRSKFDFLQWLSDFRETFFNGFPISKKPSSTAFQFVQRLSDVWETFFNGFPLSSILIKYSYREYFIFPLNNTYISPNTLLWCTCVTNSAPYLKSKLKYDPSWI